jgi:sugar phosphate isomerase/epimerase
MAPAGTDPQEPQRVPARTDEDVALVAKELREYCADAGRAELGVAVWPIRDTVQELCGRGDPQQVLDRVMRECAGECSYIVMRNGEIVDQGRRHAARARGGTPSGVVQQQGSD